ncbi:MAG: type III-A CRISPR-associated RAMP protein Csm5 [Leptospiraceae bacterium]|nr:MAG: type III-A CRISPR-associated RAMP protein Csm5 [Leptospiraceae bacterium]
MNNQVKSNLAIKIKTLSPIHIGSGNKLTNIDFVIQNKTLTVISFDKLIFTLRENRKQIDELINYLERKKKELPRELQNHIIKNLQNIKKYIIKFNDSILKKFEKNPNEIEIFENKEVLEFIKTSDSKPYIPGSEIKGAIRTAILYKILKDKWEQYKNDICYIEEEKDNKTNQIISIKNDKKLANKLEQNIFGEYSNDIMKYFLVSDSSYVNDIYIYEIHISNAKRTITEYAECINENENLEFLLKINKNLNHKYKDYITNWKNCCYEFTKDLISVEKEYWKNNNRTIFEFLNHLEKKNTNETPILRLGRFTGKLSHTIIILLKIKELESNGKIKLKKNIFPKTRRYTSDNKLLGWIQFL